MTREQADKMAAHLKGLIVTMTDAQVRMARDEIETLDDGDVLRQRLREYVTGHDKFTIASFLTAVNPDPPVSYDGPYRRTRRYNQQMAQLAKELERIGVEHDVLIDALDDQTLAAEVEIALANLPDRIANFERRRGTTRQNVGRMVKGMVVERITKMSKRAPPS